MYVNKEKNKVRTNFPIDPLVSFFFLQNYLKSVSALHTYYIFSKTFDRH